MIQKVLSAIVADANIFLKQATATEEDRLVLYSLVDQAGHPEPVTDNRLVCTLTAVEQERTAPNRNMPGGARPAPALYLNLQLLFSACFPGSYDEALQFLSLLITYFHGKPVFTPQNTPGLPPGTDKLTIEINNLTPQEQHQLWGAIGARMVPAVSMKLRMPAIRHDQLISDTPVIGGVDPRTKTN